MDWQKTQTILMALSAATVIMVGSVSAYVSVKAALADHTARLEAISENVRRIDTNLASIDQTLRQLLLPMRKASISP